jgi:hypothetical protein
MNYQYSRKQKCFLRLLVIYGKPQSRMEKGLLMNILKGILDGNPRAVGRAITLVKMAVRAPGNG